MSTGIIGCAGSAPVKKSADTSQDDGKSSGSVLPWQTSKLKIGYIRSDVITAKYADYRDADVSLRNQNRKWLKEAEDMEQEIRSKEVEIDDLALILSEDRKKTLIESLNEVRKKLQKFREDIWYSENSEYVKKRKEIIEPIDARVNDAIWIVSEEKELDLVFDTIAGNIVYVDPSFDITQDVLEELEK